MKNLNTLGADIELFEAGILDGETKYAYTITYKGECRHGWFNAPTRASDEWLGVWSLIKAEFDDPDVVNAFLDLFAKTIWNATPEELTRLVFTV
jgi:hypothetical protein